MVGAEKKFVGALIVPSFSNLKEWCRKNGSLIPLNEEMIRHPKVIEMIKIWLKVSINTLTMWNR